MPSKVRGSLNACVAGKDLIIKNISPWIKTINGETSAKRKSVFPKGIMRIEDVSPMLNALGAGFLKKDDISPAKANGMCSKELEIFRKRSY